MLPVGRRIALNGLFLDYPRTGMWSYTRHLTSAMAETDTGAEFRLAVRRGAPDGQPANVVATHPAWPLGRPDSKAPWLKRIDKVGWEQLAWPLASRDCDLLHSLYFAAPRWAPAPLVVTVHDCIPLAPRFRRSRWAGWYASFNRRTTRRAAAIIAVSHHAKAEIEKELRFDEKRIHVVYEAPDPTLVRVADAETLAAVRARYGLPESYVLYVGGCEARKNLETLVRAWAAVPVTGVKLVIVARFPPGDPFFPDMRVLARELDIVQRLVFVPTVEQMDMSALYSGATAFCYPSFYEGFGLPPVEAMACGVAVVAAHATSLPEILGDAALLIPPAGVNAWASALERVLDDSSYREGLARRGADHVRRYSWQSAAVKTLAVYDGVLGG